MKLNIHLFDESLPMPAYQTFGSIGFDIYARETTTIPAGSFGLVPTNIGVEVPEGYGLFVFSRSSTPKRKGLIIGNSVGVTDQDFNGPEDEIRLIFFNVTDKPVTLERGERCAQGVLMPVAKAELVKYKPTGKSRGGIGSTGN